MHEYSLAEKILDAILKEAEKIKAKKIKRIEISANKLTHINEEELKFSFKMVSKNTIAEDAEINIEYSQGKIFCKECKKEYILDDFFGRCPKCSSSLVEIVDEIVVSNMEIEK